MFILDSLLIGGLRFVLEAVAAAADTEARDDTALREQLLEAQMQLELGELTPAEFARIESDLLARIREIRAGGEALTLASPGVTVTGVEAHVAEELDRE